MSFGSPVVEKSVIWKNASESLISKLAKFIDVFEDYGKLSVRNGSSYSSRVDYDNYDATYLGGGVSGDAYKVSVDGNPKYVIKEPKPKRCSEPIWGPGGITHEFAMLDEFKDDSKFQQGISLMKTRDGNYYMVSEFEEGHPVGKNGYSFNPLTREGIKDTLNILEGMDSRGVFNSDWNIGNIFYKGDDKYPKMLDLQWAYSMQDAGRYYNFVPGEKRTNMASYEMGTVASYMHHLYDRTGSKAETRNFLKTYLLERANHCDTSNRFERLRKSVYQNPSEDVLDAEVLRFSMLKNHIHQFLYTDKNNEEPRDMLKMVRYQARANFAAKQLAEFQPQGYASGDEREYFSEMRDFGRSWHNKTKNDYKGSIRWMKQLVAKEVYQNDQTGYMYFDDYFGSGVDGDRKTYRNAVPDKTKLTDILSDGAKRPFDSSFRRVKDKVISLEGRFIELKQSVDRNDYETRDLESDISELTSEVLI